MIAADLPPQAFPAITELASWLALPAHDEAFAFGLEVLLAGIEAGATRSRAAGADGAVGDTDGASSSTGGETPSMGERTQVPTQKEAGEGA